MLAFTAASPFVGRAVQTSPSVSPLRPRASPARRAARAPARPRAVPRAVLAASAIANKSFQLEEDEDALSCTSAIYLSENGTVSIGKTDGPRPDRVDATWSYSDHDGELMLEIERYFGADTTPFSVKRVLRGHLDDSRKNLEGLPVFTGAMYQYPADFSPHSEVGWFAMILAVDDLPQVDFDISSSQ